MKNIDIKAKSSSGDYYKVSFEISDTIKVSCNCNAGNFGKLCKHKTGLLIGDKNFLYDQSEEIMLDEIIDIVKRSEYISLTNEFLLAQKASLAAKKYEEKIKVKLALALKEGIPIIK